MRPFYPAPLYFWTSKSKAGFIRGATGAGANAAPYLETRYRMRLTTGLEPLAAIRQLR